MSEPKVGDLKFLGVCIHCGTDVYAVCLIDRRSVGPGWKEIAHDCHRELRERIMLLEERVRNL